MMNSYNCWCEFHIELNEFPSFKLENAVCNHGFFMMAPNIWDPSTKSLSRPLRLSDSKTSVNVTVSQAQHPYQNCRLLIKVHDMKNLSSSDKKAILAQVRRMLRLSPEDEKSVQDFHKIHSEAKQDGFGRMFRSPSLFEDAIKCFLLCFCSSLKMAKSLCDIQFELLNGRLGLVKQDQQHDNEDDQISTATTKKYLVRNFPNAKELACLDEHILQKFCKTGLRTNQILEFATKVESGEYDLRAFEECISYTRLTHKLKKIKGFGNYVSANVKMCLSFYKDVPVDSETQRHLKEIHGKKNCSTKVIKEIYGKYAPFQCLAFWFEVAAYYESKVGKLSELPSSKYYTVTGSLMGRKSKEAMTDF